MNAPHKPPTTMTSREFNQDTARAKREARNGPVIITERGEPAFVMISKAEFDRITGDPSPEVAKHKNLAEALAHPESAHIDFDPPKMSGFSLRIPDFE